VRIYEDLRAVQVRLGVFQSLLLAVFALLLAYFWSLQVVRGRYFRDLADNNRTRRLTLAAPRGPLLDRGGSVLVENRPAFNVVLTPEHAEDFDGTVVRLARALGIGEAQIRERVARARRGAPLSEIVIKSDASLEDVAALEARRLELPAVTVDVVPLRSYPLAAAAAHALGRVGEVSEKQLGQPDFDGLSPGALVGQAGIEAQYNRYLMGQDGYRQVIVNSHGVEVGEAERRLPVDGPTLTLTIDASLQAALEKAFAGKAGSGVMLDPRTGEVLAMTSTPSYDPNAFTTGIEAHLWSDLVQDPATPLMNRVTQGVYSPGSTFKLVSAVAGLEEGVLSPSTSVFCSGQLAIYNTVFHCHKAGGHGSVDLRHALSLSCNVFFYQLGIRLEISRLSAWARRLGLGTLTGIDLPHEATGLMPSPEWKLRTLKTPWYAGETVSVAIGQGQVSVTPLQMAVLVSTIANGGKRVSPRLVRAVAGRPLLPCKTDDDPGPCVHPPVDLGLKPETLASVREGMISVVAEGTGWRAHLPTVVVAGKTGSAQVVARARLEKDQSEKNQPHGWFVGFAPADNPRVAFAVLVEHGRSGGEAAAPLVHDVLAQYFGRAGTALVAAGVPDTEVAEP
jgi:penicillin-binding protein 2